MPMKLKRIKRPVVRIDTRPQMPLFDGDRDAMPVRDGTAVSRPLRFVEPDPREIRFGALGLDEHLKQMFVYNELFNSPQADGGDGRTGGARAAGALRLERLRGTLRP